MRKVSAILSLVLILLSFSACGGEKSAPFDLEEYKSLVSECQGTINDASIILANAGAYENNYWKALGELRADDMVDAAFSWLADNSEEDRASVDASYSTIQESYKAIISIETEGNEAEEILSSFKSLYASYAEMYIMVTEPSGSRTDFAKSMSDLIADMKISNESLSLFLS